jgi:hypothetical protein
MCALTRMLTDWSAFSDLQARVREVLDGAANCASRPENTRVGPRLTMRDRAGQPSNAERSVGCTPKRGAMEAAEADGGKSMGARTWVCALAVMTTTVVGAKEPLSMQVSPAMSFAPANLVIRTRLEPDADNRVMEVVAESGEFYRSSAIQLDGDRAPRTTRIEFRSVPPGEYEVRAVVTGTDGRQRALVRSHVNVIESGASR